MQSIKDYKKIITEVYNDLLYVDKISVRIAENYLIEYQHNCKFKIREIQKKDLFFAKKRINVVIKIKTPYIYYLSCMRNTLPCINDKMLDCVGGEVTHFWQDNVKAILDKEEGAYCFGQDIYEVAKCCKLIEDNAKIFLRRLTRI